MPVVNIYRGLPEDRDPDASSVASAARLDWRFLLAFLLVLLCFVIILLVFCVRRRRRPTPVAVDEDVSRCFGAKTV